MRAAGGSRITTHCEKKCFTFQKENIWVFTFHIEKKLFKLLSMKKLFRKLLMKKIPSPVADIDECASDPCMNDGTCTDLVNGFSCNCTGNYTGSMCNIGTANLFDFSGTVGW